MTRAVRPGDQPMPTDGAQDVGPAVVEDVRKYSDMRNAEIVTGVAKDFEARIQIGIERYGHPLQTNNGRDALDDAYQELLDAAHYLKQRYMESGATRVQLAYWSVLGLIFDLREMKS